MNILVVIHHIPISVHSESEAKQVSLFWGNKNKAGSGSGFVLNN
jgi:hypothetical protein